MSDSNSARFAEPASSSHPSRPGAARYRVFLSYSHADTKWARWLMRRLELYRVPRRFHGRAAPIGEVGWRIAPVFRDRDELPTTSDLGETIRAALRESATLVVICSPSSAKSRWVQEEILAFKRLHGERRVFAFIIGGEPKIEGAAEDCFSPALRVEIGADGQLSAIPAEVVAADARAEGDGPKLAFIRLVAGLLGVGFDELRQREQQRRNRRLMVITGCSLAGMALTFGLAVVAWQARNDARRRQDQAEDVFAFMLGDFRPELKKVGRLDLLDKVGDKAMAYFDALDARDVTDTTLARQAKALTQIGEIRMEQKDARYADAGRAFFTAYQRAAALAARHSENGDMLFERAQAEFWIGYVHWKRREITPAREWLTRYRDSAHALLALEGPVLRARREVISGHHNLAVLELDVENLASARASFLAELAMHRELLASNPGDGQIAFRIADTLSWLGVVAEQAGELREAVARYAEWVAALDVLSKADPKTAHWRFRLADSKGAYAALLAITGQSQAAQQQIAEARTLLTALVSSDRSNRRWQLSEWTIQLQEVAYSPARWTTETIAPVEHARREIEKHVAAEPKDRAFSKRLGFAWRVEAAVRHHARNADAVVTAARAVEIGEMLIRGESTSDLLGACAHAHLLVARIAAPDDADAVGRNAQRAVEILRPRAEHSRDWRLLDPLARALALLGRESECRGIIARLEAIDYRPIEPWPVPTLPANEPIHKK